MWRRIFIPGGGGGSRPTLGAGRTTRAGVCVEAVGACVAAVDLIGGTGCGVTRRWGAGRGPSGSNACGPAARALVAHDMARISIVRCKAWRIGRPFRSVPGQGGGHYSAFRPRRGWQSRAAYRSGGSAFHTPIP